jgi:ATP-binding cassette subfamily B protein
MLVIMLALNWKLGLLAAVSAPLIWATSMHYRARIRNLERNVREKEGDIASLAQETISSIRVVKTFGGKAETRRFEHESGEMLEAGLRVARLEARFSWTLSVITALALALLVIVGANQVLAGAITAGTLVVFIQYLRDIQGPLTTLSRLSTRVAKAMVRANRINEVLSERPAVQELPGARVAERFRGHIRFEHVSFGYLPGRNVLHDVTLEALPGQVVALVGSSGAGKSSLASLLPRLYDPTEGRVLIDGQDVREFQLESLRSHIAVVLQESLLFRASIRENIAFGRPKASLRQIEEATRIACCDEFLQELPHGLDTVVGERGVTLSGGQRQRIAIARAVIRDAPILILDEPTTGLDAESEAGVMQALERLMEGRTTIMIAHKLSTVLRADKIAVMHQGAIVEVGTHGELLGSDGLYARAFQTQTAALFD